MAEVYMPDRLKSYFSAIESNERISAYLKAGAGEAKLQGYFNGAAANMDKLNLLYSNYPEKLKQVIKQIPTMDNDKVKAAYAQFSNRGTLRKKYSVNKIKNGRDNMLNHKEN